MIIERFFGKGRAASPEAEPQAQAQAQSKPRPKGETRPRHASGTTAPSETAAPRIEATDAPASLARSSGAVVAKPPSASPVEARPVLESTHDDIAVRAYHLWVTQGRPDGSAYQNWFEAEAQLRAERAAG